MPASGDVLRDSSVVVPYFRGDAAVRSKIQTSGVLCLPQTALGELFCGAHLCGNPARALAEIQNFLSAVVVLSPGVSTAEHYGRIRSQLAKAGTPIPDNDIWIGAIAIEHDLPVAVRDAHFDRIAGLKVLKW